MNECKYATINKFYEIIDENCNGLNKNEINLIVGEFKKLNWEGLQSYYTYTNRTNLLNLSFVLWKILTSSDKFNNTKNKYYDINIKKYNNGLQNMLWEILNPDLMEFS